MAQTQKEFKYNSFSVFGLELEYMVVDSNTLDVLACADKVLIDDDGQLSEELEFNGDIIGWSNELATHVLEFKVIEPVSDIHGMSEKFHAHVQKANERLKPLGAILMSGAAHPWMMPDKDFVIWPHANKEIYGKYDEIFGCKGHGWSNLQSAHINFPFKNDAEFAKLHAALRVIIPITSSLTAASPYLEGKFTGQMDSRMEIYRNNARRVPEMAGLVVPETVNSEKEYEEIILNPLYDALAPLDPEGILRYEWANSRGCIARFDRGSIELRTISTQECPAMDMAIADLISQLAKALSEEKWAPIQTLNAVPTDKMHSIFLDTINHAENATIDDPDYLACFGLTKVCKSGEIWEYLYAELKPQISTDHYEALDHLFANGTLATRMLKVAGKSPSQSDLKTIAKMLVNSLSKNMFFAP